MDIPICLRCNLLYLSTALRATNPEQPQPLVCPGNKDEVLRQKHLTNSFIVFNAQQDYHLHMKSLKGYLKSHLSSCLNFILRMQVSPTSSPYSLQVSFIMFLK